jgi:hypothetical protein
VQGNLHHTNNNSIAVVVAEQQQHAMLACMHWLTKAWGTPSSCPYVNMFR